MERGLKRKRRGRRGGCWEEFKRVTRGGITNIFEDEPVKSFRKWMVDRKLILHDLGINISEREREGEKEKFFSKIESYIYKKKCVNKG